MNNQSRNQSRTKNPITLRKPLRVRRRNKPLVFIIVGVMLLLMIVAGVHVVQASNMSSPLPQAKVQEQEREQQEIARARAQHRSKPAPYTPSSQTVPQRQAGIVDMHQGPFPSTQYAVHNFWQGPVGVAWELVYAGAKMEPDGIQGPGVLVIYTEAANSDGSFSLNYIGTYLTPNGGSALSITAVTGHVLQLRTDTGSTLAFDLQTNRFG